MSTPSKSEWTLGWQTLCSTRLGSRLLLSSGGLDSTGLWILLRVCVRDLRGHSQDGIIPAPIVDAATPMI
jgi:hypothetical protein